MTDAARPVLLDLLRQRIYALALGYEDLNDHGELRHDPALQTASGRMRAVPAGARANRETAVAIHRVLFEVRGGAPEAPRRVHGFQEERFFHALCGYCSPAGEPAPERDRRGPSCLGDPVAAGPCAAGPLAPGGRVPGGQRVLPLADAALVRGPWGGVYRGDARNRRLLARAQGLMDRSAAGYGATGRKQRVFGSVWYGARTWDRARRVIVKAEHGPRGANPRFVVTMKQTDRYLWDVLPDPDLFAGRASCRRFWSNQFRQLLSGLAYALVEQGTTRRIRLQQFLSVPGVGWPFAWTPPVMCPGTLTNKGGGGRCARNPLLEGNQGKTLLLLQCQLMPGRGPARPLLRATRGAKR